MSVSIHRLSVPVFQRGLSALSFGLTKAAETGRPPEEILGARLAPDMLPYSAQIQRVSDTAKNAIGRVLGVTPPVMVDEEKTVAELQERIARTAAYLDAQSVAALDARAGAEVVMKIGGKDVTFTAEDYLLNFALPNFYFHVVTAHGILRMLGVAIGKREYLGSFG